MGATMRRDLTRVVLAVCLVFALFLPSGAASAVVDGYYKVAYGDDIFIVDDGVARRIDFQEWADAGFPSPQPAPTEYVRYPWSSAIYALTRWGDDASTWLWDWLSFSEWQRAGYPAPRPVSWIPGSYVYRWGTAPEIFVLSEDGVNHKLTFDEWAATGFQAFDDRTTEGWAKLSWSTPVARMSDLASGQGYPVTYEEWRNHDFPTPALYQRFPGDQFNRYIGDVTIYYSGPTMSRAITYAEWGAAGFPAPNLLTRAPVDCSRVACVALTFDDGPSANTDRLIDTLMQLNAPATFFVVGSQVANRPAVVRRLQAEGFAVENHTYSHPQLTLLSLSAQRTEVERADDALAAANVARSTLLRPPYGSWDGNTRLLGKPLILWSVDPRDWDGRTATQIRNHVVTYTSAGDIVLMHDTVAATVSAVPGIVADLRARGYTLVTVKELVPGMAPGDVVYSRNQVTPATTALDPFGATLRSPSGIELGPVVDEAPF